MPHPNIYGMNGTEQNVEESRNGSKKKVDAMFKHDILSQHHLSLSFFFTPSPTEHFTWNPFHLKMRHEER